jgi:hypothetical protein
MWGAHELTNDHCDSARTFSRDAQCKKAGLPICWARGQKGSACFRLFAQARTCRNAPKGCTRTPAVVYRAYIEELSCNLLAQKSLCGRTGRGAIPSGRAMFAANFDREYSRIAIPRAQHAERGTVGLSG